jgi:hypothetical protein
MVTSLAVIMYFSCSGRLCTVRAAVAILLQDEDFEQRQRFRAWALTGQLTSVDEGHEAVASTAYLAA